jgi:hypothetical protein
LAIEPKIPRLTAACVAGARQELLGRGFTLVATPPFADDDLYVRLTRHATTLTPRCPRWKKFPQLARYGQWLEDLLGQTLPEESLGLVTLEFRREPAGCADPEVDRLHADGSYLRAVFTPFGPTTVYREGKTEQSVPAGQTLLMTAMNRARATGLPCTLHRRPGAGPERAVIVCSFEPCREQLQPAPALRRVAPARSL